MDGWWRTSLNWVTALILCVFSARAALLVGKSEFDGGKQQAGINSSSAIDRTIQTIDWIAARGGTGTENVRSAFIDKGGGHLVRGLVAARDFEAGAVVFTIPDDVRLYDTHPRVHDTFLRIDSAWLDEDNCMDAELGPFTLLLAIERRRTENANTSYPSHWSVYIRSLPTASDLAQSNLRYAEDALLERFSFLPLARRAQDLNRCFAEVWARRQQVWTQLARDTGCEGLTWEDLRWANAIIRSRMFQRHGMVPLWDMVNHGSLRASNVRVRGMSKSPLVIEAKRAIKKGEELTESYGDRSNEEFLDTYGFMLLHNPINSPDGQLNSAVCKDVGAPMYVAPSPEVRQPELEIAMRTLTNELCVDEGTAYYRCWLKGGYRCHKPSVSFE